MPLNTKIFTVDTIFFSILISLLICGDNWYEELSNLPSFSMTLYNDWSIYISTYKIKLLSFSIPLMYNLNIKFPLKNALNKIIIKHYYISCQMKSIFSFFLITLSQTFMSDLRLSFFDCISLHLFFNNILCLGK